MEEKSEVLTLCCGKSMFARGAYVAVQYNEYNSVVVCYACGHVYLPAPRDEKGEYTPEAQKLIDDRGRA